MTMTENSGVNRGVVESAGEFFEGLDLIMVGVLFIQSLLIAWFVFLILQAYDVPPLLRLMRGIAVLFAVLVPVFLVIEGFRYTSPTAGFFVPLFLYAVTFPLFDSLVHHLNLFLVPTVMLPGIVGGIGFGFIGLGAYHLKRNALKTFALATAGTTLIFISSPAILAGFLYVLSGDPGLVSAFLI
jgi:hypothetical protein